MTKPKQPNVLSEAESLIYGDRNKSYGHPLDDYQRTVDAFNALTGHKLTAAQGIIFMICVKLSRESHRPKRDNRVDGAGYFGCLDEAIVEGERRQKGNHAHRLKKT